MKKKLPSAYVPYRYFVVVYWVATVGGFSSPAQAYIGPGMATGAIAWVLGLASALGMLFFGMIWYPIKRLYRRIRRRA
jgi:hypothetical protein